MRDKKHPPRPIDPRAGKLCTACNKPKTDVMSVPHCKNPQCKWWRCAHCKAFNDETGANSHTLRNGEKRRPYGG